MKYLITKIDVPDFSFTSVTIKNSDSNATNFPAEISNPNYDQFLVDAKLTDKQVKALKLDVWYDFPEGDK
jgi:hypothetical protein